MHRDFRVYEEDEHHPRVIPDGHGIRVGVAAMDAAASAALDEQRVSDEAERRRRVADEHPEWFRPHSADASAVPGQVRDAADCAYDRMCDRVSNAWRGGR
jgi:hypothetical protein